MANKIIMAKEVAEKEVEKWFDYRRVKDSARFSPDENTGKDILREKLIESFMYGELIFDDKTGVLKQILIEPVKKESGEIVLKELNFKPRIKRSALNEPMKSVKTNDTDGRLRAWISAITGANKAYLGSMDTSDYSTAEAIVTYFL